MSCCFMLLRLMLRISCLDMEMKMLQFFRQGALLHAGEVTAGVVTGEDRHGELVLSVLVLVLLHFTEMHNL